MAEEHESTMYLARHAEKQSNVENPGLTDAGEKRANLLSDLLADAGITTIWSTDFNRTRLTAEPLASRLDIPVQIYDHNALDDLAENLAENQADSGQVALVVGHSNTTTELVRLLGGSPGSPIADDGEYDRLYRVRIKQNGTVETELRRYGEPYQSEK